MGRVIFNGRRRLNMSRATFAQKVGISDRHAARIEAGEINVGLRVVVRISRILKLPLSVIFREPKLNGRRKPRV